MSSKELMEKYGKDKVEREIKETLQTKKVIRCEAALIGLIAFSIMLWGSKIFTLISPDTSVIIPTFVLFGETYNIHMHHFHFGIIMLVIGIITTFFEGRWFVRIGHAMFGGGLGLIVDEYWLLLIFRDTSLDYFSHENLFISAMIGLVVTLIYAVIALGNYYRTKKERNLWQKLYDAVKKGEAKINF